MRLRYLVYIRLALAITAGLIVAGIALDTGISGARYYLSWKPRLNKKYLARVDAAIIIYRKKYGRFPRALKELGSLPESVSPFIQPDGMVHDIWDNPFIYRRTGKSYILLSLGRDDKLGGIGLDCDQSNRDPLPQASKIPAIQALRDPDSRSFIIASLFCGLLTAVLCFSTIRLPQPKVTTLGSSVVGYIAILVFSAFIAQIVAVLHVSKH